MLLVFNCLFSFFFLLCFLFVFGVFVCVCVGGGNFPSNIGVIGIRMKINNSEYLHSQYADDSSLILDGGDDSLEIYILEKFSECAGLKQI